MTSAVRPCPCNHRRKAVTLVKLRAAACALMAISCPALPAQASEPMTLADYMALEGLMPTERIDYGRSPFQYVELFKPAGAGPFPVVVLIQLTHVLTRADNSVDRLTRCHRHRPPGVRCSTAFLASGGSSTG